MHTTMLSHTLLKPTLWAVSDDAYRSTFTVMEGGKPRADQHELWFVSLGKCRYSEAMTRQKALIYAVDRADKVLKLVR